MQDYRSIWTTHLFDLSFRQGFVDAGGIRTRYAQAGAQDAPAVIMLHGTGGTWENWCANIGPMSQHFNCWAIDLIGSGLSDKPDYDYEISVYLKQIHGFMQAVGLERASLVGLSMGGWIASAFTLEYPERVDRLVLIGSSGMLVDEANSARIQSSRANAVSNASWETIEGVFANLLPDETMRMDDLVALRLNFYRQPGMKSAMEHVVALQGGAIRDRNLIPEEDWKKIKAPTLVVAGLADREVYVRTARKMIELIPDSRLVELDKVGHWAQFQAAERLNQEMINFMRV